ncbi:MAG: maltose/glucose-specific PTS transporter subunit IIBC [Brevinema sp.]
MKQKISLWDFFQGLGKTFMLPVALLAAMGIFLGIGSSLTSSAVQDSLPFLKLPVLQLFFQFISTVGAFAFINLPILFAMAIPLGLVREEKGVAALSGYVGFVVLNLSINFFLSVTGSLAEAGELKQAGQAMIMGIQSIDTGVLGGVIVGLIVYKLHTRFYEIQFPDAFAFFGGARFVPIITALTLSVFGLIVPFVWPIFDSGIRGIGAIIQNSGILAPFLFISAERLLLPFGLHHILVATVRFTPVGGEMLVNNEMISGALNIYYAQLAAGTEFSASATRFLSQAKMPFMMFGLPGVALAIYHSAKKERQHIVKSLLLSGAISSIVAGISEPIEFLFLFMAPMLYFFHVVMSGLGALVLGILGVAIGNTDGNLIDLLVFGVLQGLQTKWYLVIPVGIIWFMIYYIVFKWAIIKFDIKTPGREENASTANTETVVIKNYIAEKILEGLGGKENIVTLDNCITRLRITVNDMTLINDGLIKDAGALNIIKLDKTNLQVIIGPQVHVVKSQLMKLI